MRLTFATIAMLAVVGACSGDSTKIVEPAAPADFAGTFTGGYQSGKNPGSYTATLKLTQSGRDVSGTFIATTNNSTQGVSGTVVGTRLNATFALSTGTCPSTTVAEIDIISNGTIVSGTYTTTDCQGAYIGAFTLNKQ